MSTLRTPSTSEALPIVLAPMAGGPSTPELTAAVSNAGGLGMLAAGYLSAQALIDAARSTASLLSDGHTFGINLFCPDSVGDNETEENLLRWAEFRDLLAPVAEKFDVDLPSTPTWSDDHFTEKLEAICADDFLPSPGALEYVSFTFGYPDADVVARVKETGRKVVLNATSIDGVRAAADAGADRIVLQGLAAGGHRGYVDGKDSSDIIGATIDELAAAVAEATRATDVSIIAAGGVGGAEDVVKLLRAGATAVQVGTRFLTAEEAGTKPTHARALLELQGRETTLTHAFSGKPARTISNRFAEEFSAPAPALYPQLHYLTTPIRGAANTVGDPEYLNLWAGTGYSKCKAQPAAEIVAELAGC